MLKSLQMLGMEEEYKDFSMRIRWVTNHPQQYRGDRRCGEDLDGLYGTVTIKVTIHIIR